MRRRSLELGPGDEPAARALGAGCGAAGALDPGGHAGEAAGPTGVPVSERGVLFFIQLGSRKVHIAGVTEHPNEAWMRQVARNLTMDGWGFLDACHWGQRFLIQDRDTKFCASFRRIIGEGGVQLVRLPPRSPDVIAERFVRTIKDECLSRLILFGEAGLRHALKQFVEHYHQERIHQGRGNMLLFPAREPPDRSGPVECAERLGGLLKFYHRRAA